MQPFTRNIDRLAAAFTTLFLAATLSACVGGESSGPSQFPNFNGDDENKECWSIAPQSGTYAFSRLKILAKQLLANGVVRSYVGFQKYELTAPN